MTVWAWAIAAVMVRVGYLFATSADGLRIREGRRRKPPSDGGDGGFLVGGDEGGADCGDGGGGCD